MEPYGDKHFVWASRPVNVRAPNLPSSKRGIGSVVGLMRPRTAALPTVGVSSNASAGARRFFAAPSRCIFGRPIYVIETCPMIGRRADGRNMGTDTFFGHRNKAAASCRTPNASRLPTRTASAAAREKPLGSARLSLRRSRRAYPPAWRG